MLEDIYEYHELCAQPYRNMKISSGRVDGHPVDMLYLKLERNGESEPCLLLLRPDEMAAIAYCASGVLWSDHMARLSDLVKDIECLCGGNPERTDIYCPRHDGGILELKELEDAPVPPG